MQDLNDFYYFAKVVEYQGFSAAARKLNITKSALSKRVNRLEATLHTRLIERSTRGFRVTETGEKIYTQCLTIIAGIDAANATAMNATATPRGKLRFACPPGIAHDALARILPGFINAYPEIKLALSVSNRRVDVIEDGLDLALRVRQHLDTDPDLIVRKLGISRRVVTASPDYLTTNTKPQSPTDLMNHSILSINDEIKAEEFTFVSRLGESATLTMTPNFAASDFRVLLEAAIGGAGIAILPANICHTAIKAGQLTRILPDWHSNESIVHIVFPSRRHLMPATRTLIDYLVKHLPAEL